MGFAPKIRFAPDSPLEGTGFEPSVPRDTTNLSSRLWLVPANRKVGAKENRHTKRRALPPRNRWFESCSLQRRVRLSCRRGLCRSRTLGFSHAALATSRSHGKQAVGADLAETVQDRARRGTTTEAETGMLSSNESAQRRHESAAAPRSAA